MRKALKNNLLEIFKTIYEAHEIVKGFVDKKEYENAQNLLADCQDTAIQLGNLIEESEGEGFVTVSFLEEYCEALYEAATNLSDETNGHKVQKQLDKKIIKAENSAKNDIKVKLEIVFMPYKASMWDSLESVWKAAAEDPDCDAYVVPIPYYDRNPDRSFGEFHYEGGYYPDYVPVVHYEAYNLEQRRPDVIYIHNPYDGNNLVTSVDPRFYSSELKKYTECLVYVPYYSTTGSMSEARGCCSAFYNVDYIVIQSELFRKYFDPKLPKEKFLTLGSPKIDKILNMCKNIDEIPNEWKSKIEGKKVFFYNTSIAGMLADTNTFLNKMEYVFKCFEKHKNVCLLWRPHPLLESTFTSMRPHFVCKYRRLKHYFISNDIGIYDCTPNVELSIAVSDVYVGDMGSSLVSLFGIVGKQLFIMDNRINTAPKEDDWRGELINPTSLIGDYRWMLTSRNHLYFSENSDFNYKFFCKLSDSSHSSYSIAITVKEKTYFLPISACDIPVVENKKVKKIYLKEFGEKSNLFVHMVSNGEYLFLIPNRYPYIVRVHIASDQVTYINVESSLFQREFNGQLFVGKPCVYKNYIYIPSPCDNRVLSIDVITGETRTYYVGSENSNGLSIFVNDTALWILPCFGTVIRKWKPDEGVIHEYDCMIDGFACLNNINGQLCDGPPFAGVVFTGTNVYFSTYMANMCVKLDEKTGIFSEWIPPVHIPDAPINGYYNTALKCHIPHQTGKDNCLFFSYYDRSLYEIQLDTNSYRKIEISFNYDDLIQYESGFSSQYNDLQYACMENALDSLDRLLENNIIGASFNYELQLKAYSEMAVNSDGSCGSKIHQTISALLRK